MTITVAPSILSANFAALGDAVRAVERGGADLVHVDVMDGHFVPNITIGPPVVKALKKVASVPLDVHLMISDPDRYLEAFAEAGAARLHVHVEAVHHLHRTITAIKGLGLKAGVAINPATPVTALEEIVFEADVILVMSVNPGFGGQAFIPRSLPKVRAIADLIERSNSQAVIAIDGGIEPSNAAQVVAAGVSILVAGQAIFGQSDPADATERLRAAALAGLSVTPRC